MARVSVPNTFFRKARQEYTDWTYAWWREATQNSVDAGATKIDIKLEETADGVAIWFADNGTGMSEEVLVNSFFTMGGSFKVEGATGGFGYAKTLLLFSNEKWKVITQGLEVNGSGGDYEVTSFAPHYMNGTCLAVEVKDDTLPVNLLSRLRYNLVRFLSNYETRMIGRDIQIKLNGEVVKTFNNPEIPRDLMEIDTTIGRLSFGERICRDRTTQVWICVNALPMFVMQMWADKPMIAYLDLDANSTECLTSNRDALLPTYANMVQQLVTKLTQNAQALRRKPGIDLIINHTSSDLGATYFTRAPSDEQLVEVFKAETEKLNEKLRATASKWRTRIDERLYPVNWRFTVDGDLESKAYQLCQTHRAAKLANNWRAACCLVLDTLALTEQFNGQKVAVVADEQGRDWLDGNGQFTVNDVPVAFGFVFRENVEAICMKGDKAGITLSVNPLTLRDDTNEHDLLAGDLLDCALHEIAHIWEDNHTESFVQVYDQLRADVRREYAERVVLQHGKEMFRRRSTPSAAAA